MVGAQETNVRCPGGGQGEPLTSTKVPVLCTRKHPKAPRAPMQQWAPTDKHPSGTAVHPNPLIWGNIQTSLLDFHLPSPGCRI